MHEHRRLILLVLIMAAVAATIGASGIYIIYQGGIERERGRLQDIVQVQARLLEGLARFDATDASPPDGSLKPFIDVFRTFRSRGLGHTGEIALARREGDDIVFLLRQHPSRDDAPMRVPLNSPLAEPMQAALRGQSGTMIGQDYEGETVLAAYEPVAGLNLGLVAKTELAEVRDRFTRAAMPMFAIGLLAIAAAATLFYRITEPVLRRLRESETRFRGTFENAAVGIAHIGFDGVWLRVNDRLCDIVGYPRDELLERTFQDITHPDDLQVDLDLFHALVRGEISTYAREKRYIRSDGAVVWVNLTISLQRNEAGRPLYAICIIEDVSLRKRTEQTLQESQNRMRAVLDASEDEVLLVSTEGRVLAINETAQQRLAHRIAKLDPVGADLAELLPADLAETRLATVRNVALSRTPAHQDLQVRGRWFEFWYYPVGHTGQPIAEVAVFARDITERRRAEGELRRLYQAIQQSPSSVVITDLKGRIVYVNPKFCQLTGYAYEEAIGCNPRILKSGFTSHREYERLWETITSGRTWHGVFRNRKKNGQFFWENASIAPVKNERGEITNFVAVKEDVTERRAVEDQLRQSQKMQAIGQLTGGIAHDFNNLLAIIVGNLQLLERSAQSQNTLTPLIADALWAARRGAGLTHRLLAFARLQPLKPAEINLNDTVRGLTQLLRRTLGAGIDVVEELEPDIPSIVADAGELERTLVNLAINARDAMPEGGRLTVQTGQAILDEDYVILYPDVIPGTYVVLSVSDTGTGIPSDILGRIFEPFFTTKKAGEGSGLGLSMVYGFVKQSGGHISASSEVGSGTTFKLFFPPVPSVVAATGDTAAEEDAAFSTRGLVALVVEDEERLRKVACRFLKEAGFAVCAAKDGGDAMQQADASPRLDLLFTDLELPGGMNGLATARHIQEHHPQVKILYTTGYGADLAIDRGGAQDEASVLPKPYARQQLMRELRALFPEEVAPVPRDGHIGSVSRWTSGDQPEDVSASLPPSGAAPEEDDGNGDTPSAPPTAQPPPSDL